MNPSGMILEFVKYLVDGGGKLMIELSHTLEADFDKVESNRVKDGVPEPLAELVNSFMSDFIGREGKEGTCLFYYWPDGRNIGFELDYDNYSEEFTAIIFETAAGDYCMFIDFPMFNLVRDVRLNCSQLVSVLEYVLASGQSVTDECFGDPLLYSSLSPSCGDSDAIIPDHLKSLRYNGSPKQFLRIQKCENQFALIMILYPRPNKTRHYLISTEHLDAHTRFKLDESNNSMVPWKCIDRLDKHFIKLDTGVIPPEYQISQVWHFYV